MEDKSSKNKKIIISRYQGSVKIEYLIKILTELLLKNEDQDSRGKL